MTFFEEKEQAKKDGMEVTGKTNKKDIEAFYADKEAKLEEVDVVEEVKEPKVKVVEVIKEVPAKCEHIYEFKNIQAVRGVAPRDADGKPILDNRGNEIPGKRLYKDRYVCKLCGEVELRDSK